MAVPSLVTHGAAPTPEELEEQAKSLGTRTDLTVIGKDGLTVHGTNLEGYGIKRPSMLLARAAELYAEKALSSGDFSFFEGGAHRDKALGIWEDSQDWRTPVGYLRLYRARYGKANALQAATCDYYLAQCYEHQGDTEAAVALYKTYATVPASNEFVGRCKAEYALHLVRERQFKEAMEIAEEVKAKCPAPDIYRLHVDAFGLALQALNQIPAEFREGASPSSAQEGSLLAVAKENPRKYLQLGQIAEQQKEMGRATEYYTLFRRSFPTDETSINLGLKLGKIYAEMKQIPKAMEAYQSVWVTNPNLMQAASARIAAAQVTIQGGRVDEAIKILQEGLAQSQAAAVKATLLASLAEVYLTNRRTDEAATLYIQLMTQYGEQNAAKGAVEKLKTIVPSIKNWQGITQQIMAWITGARAGGRPPFGIHELTPQAVSDVRRLALRFYIQNDDFRNGLSWLQQCGAKSRDEDLTMVVQDETWFYGEVLQEAVALSARGKLKPTEIPNLLDMGLRGWGISQSSEEGWNTLKSTVQFVKAVKPKPDRVRKLCDELKSLQGTPYEEEAMNMLVEVLTAVGETKEAEKIRKQIGG